MYPPAPSLPRAVFGIIRQRNTYAGLLYVLVSFPIALATFVVWVAICAFMAHDQARTQPEKPKEPWVRWA